MKWAHLQFTSGSGAPKTAVVLAFLALCCGALEAATIPGRFRQVNMRGGGWLSGISAHSGGRLYARTDVGGAYRSDDHGDTWNFLSGDFTSPAPFFVQGIAPSPANADVVLAACGVSYYATDANRGIWRSTDAGVTWSQVKAGINFSGNDALRWGGECIAWHPTVANEVWCGSRGNGLWRSADGGLTWTQAAAATFAAVNIGTICIHPAFPDQIWVGGDGGAWVSTDHGATWVKKVTTGKTWRVVRLANGKTFLSGETTGANCTLERVTATDWANPATYTFTSILTNYFTGLPYSDNNWKLPMLTVLANGMLVVGDLYEFTRKSSNEGTAWTTVPRAVSGTMPPWNPGNGRTTSGNQITQDPTNPSRWFMASGYGPFRTGDSGATWQYVLTGVEELVAWRVRFHPTDPSRVAIPLADMGACVITDGGASGNVQGFVLPNFRYPDDEVMFSQRPIFSGTKIIAPGGEQGAHKARIFVTTNDGATWTKPAFTGLPTASGRELLDAVPSPDNADDFLVAVAGATGTGGGGIHRTVNGGAAFTQATGIPASKPMGDEFYHHVALAADAVAPAVRYFLFRNQGFYKSTDRGATWTKPAAQPRSNYARLFADGAIGGRAWIPIEGTGLDASSDGGVSWSAVAGFTTAITGDAHNGRVCVVGRRTGDTFDKIYYSADNGATWNEITRTGWRFGNVQAVAVDPHRAGQVWISTGGRGVTIFTPFTPVQSWRQQNFGTPDPVGIAADDADSDHDGVVNLFEYATGGSPLVSDSAGRPAMSIESGCLTLTLPKNPSATDAIWSAESCGDLLSWSAGTATVLLNNATTFKARDNFVIGSTLPRFLRAKVVLP